MSLTEKYRPRRLADVAGQPSAVSQLRGWLEAPSSHAFIFAGSTGTGKTTIARCLAAELGCDVAEAECGGLIEIGSGDQTADAVRDQIRALGMRPMFGSGWRVLVLSEGDRMSTAVQYLWLDALESIPPRCVVIMTTNRLDKLERRLETRFETIVLQHDPSAMLADAQRLADRIWSEETGRTDSPRVRAIAGAIVDGELSLRALVRGLEPLIRSAKQRTTQEALSFAEASPVPQPAANAFWGTSDGLYMVRLAKSLGVCVETLAKATGFATERIETI
jgi:replication-associated recombination protein RarA